MTIPGSIPSAPPTQDFRYLATTALGLGEALAEELRALGLTTRSVAPNRVTFAGTLHDVYRACIWSRLATRMLLHIGSYPAADEAGLYEAAHSVDWGLHLNQKATFMVAMTTRSSWLRNTHFGAQRVKDAIVDRMRALHGARPSVDREQPDLRIHAHLQRDRLELSLQLTREAVFRRKNVLRGTQAPMKENLAAAVLVRAGWPALCEGALEATLLDPMCGSGTLLTEGAMMAADLAPGLAAASELSQWPGHDRARWQTVLAEARERFETGKANLAARFVGYDKSPQALAVTRENLAALGLDDHLELARQDVAQLSNAAGAAGLLVCNPPYGTRLKGEPDAGIEGLYRSLGERIRSGFDGWRCAILGADEAPLSELRLSRARRYKFRNGAIPCTLVCADLGPRPSRSQADTPGEPAERSPPGEAELADLARGEPFANRLRKNLRHLTRWAKRRGITCYRLYDADLPEFAFAVDLYESTRRLVYVQEYAPPATVPAKQAAQRRRAALAVLRQTLELSPSQLFFRERKRQSGAEQYEKLDDRRRFHEVNEAGAKLLVNLNDYLDTGLFLDHRPVRRYIMENASGTRFLNLFAYTATASVAAAKGGAASTLSVDASRVYTEWAGMNFELNELDRLRHRIVRADCWEWLDGRLDEASRRGPGFDLIYVDPPTFSNSKGRERDFDVQRDHAELLGKTMRLLRPGGSLLFTTNRRRFELDADLARRYSASAVKPALLDEDFSRRPNIHHCFTLRHPDAG